MQQATEYGCQIARPFTNRLGSRRPAALTYGQSTQERSRLCPYRRQGYYHLPNRLDCRTRVWPFDLAWDVDSQTLASNLFASSIIPYAGFLYHLQRSKKAPKLTLFGFYFLLVFVFSTIVAGITAKLKYGTILANVDWLHGSAESFLTITNLLIVLGLRQGILEAEKANLAAAAASAKEASKADEKIEQKS